MKYIQGMVIGICICICVWSFEDLCKRFDLRCEGLTTDGGGLMFSRELAGHIATLPFHDTSEHFHTLNGATNIYSSDHF